MFNFNLLRLYWRHRSNINLIIEEKLCQPLCRYSTYGRLRKDFPSIATVQLLQSKLHLR